VISLLDYIVVWLKISFMIIVPLVFAILIMWVILIIVSLLGGEK
jgi:hypothetical protein